MRHRRCRRTGTMVHRPCVWQSLTCCICSRHKIGHVFAALMVSQSRQSIIIASVFDCTLKIEWQYKIFCWQSSTPFLIKNPSPMIAFVFLFIMHTIEFLFSWNRNKTRPLRTTRKLRAYCNWQLWKTRMLFCLYDNFNFECTLCSNS